MDRILDEKTEQNVRGFLAGMHQPVEVLFFERKDQNCTYCEDTKKLLGEVADCSEKLHLSIYDLDQQPDIASQYHVDKAPAIVIASREGGEIQDHGIRYFGIPAGHEFTSLIRDLLMVSSGDSGLQETTRKKISDLNSPIRLQVFVTPTCAYCPQAVILAHQMALESPLIEAEMIEAMEFPELAERYQVSGVPHTIVNDGVEDLIGANPEEVLLEKIVRAASLHTHEN